MIGTFLLAGLYLTLLVSALLFCSVSDKKTLDKRQEWLAHWDPEPEEDDWI